MAEMYHSQRLEKRHALQKQEDIKVALCLTSLIICVIGAGIVHYGGGL